MGSPRTAPERKDDEGAIGIGTMIVFIAMVIVAAVAAAVLINTAGSLQRQASSTGQETSHEVSGNIFVRDIVGNITDNAGDGDAVERVEWYLSLAPGSDPVDLTQLVLRWEHGDSLADVQHVDNVDGVTQCDYDTNFSLATGHFCVETIIDPDDGDPNVLSEGDRTKILITLDDTSDEEVDVRESASVLLIPERGTPVDAGFNTPATFSGRSNLSLK